MRHNTSPNFSARGSETKMTYRKAKWLIYTVLVGLIPFIARLFIYLTLKEKNIEFLLNESDFIIFGLVLHITTINELEHFESDNKSWKTVQNGLSLIFIIVYAIIFGLSCIDSVNPGIFEKSAMVWSSILLSFISLLISYSTCDRISKLSSV